MRSINNITIRFRLKHRHCWAEPRIYNFPVFTVLNISPKFSYFGKNLNIFAKRSSSKFIFFKIVAKHVPKWFLCRNDRHIWENLQQNFYLSGFSWNGGRGLINYWQVKIAYLPVSINIKNFHTRKFYQFILTLVVIRNSQLLTNVIFLFLLVFDSLWSPPPSPFKKDIRAGAENIFRVFNTSVKINEILFSTLFVFSTVSKLLKKAITYWQVAWGWFGIFSSDKWFKRGGGRDESTT